MVVFSIEFFLNFFGIDFKQRARSRLNNGLNFQLIQMSILNFLFDLVGDELIFEALIILFIVVLVFFDFGLLNLFMGVELHHLLLQGIINLHADLDIAHVGQLNSFSNQAAHPFVEEHIFGHFLFFLWHFGF